MRTKIGKVLAVFIAAVGVAFLGFVGVTLVGGPNWEARMKADDLRDYVFEQSDDEVPNWSVKRLYGGKAVGSPTKLAPKAIEDARKDLKDKQSKETQELENDLEYWTKQVAQSKKFIEQDTKALEDRQAELQKELDDLNKKIEEVSAAITNTAKQVLSKQAESARRLEDVRLYQAQLEELKSDRFRALEQQKILRDQLLRLRGTNERLERRNEQLKQATPAKK
jgi:hypothetical protein